MSTSEEISKAMKILYCLMQQGELSEEAEKELYRSYCESEEIMSLVKLQGRQCQCSIQKYSGVIYLIPDEDNDFLGYSKAELKKELCRSNPNDKDYYLSQFVILTLLNEIYGSAGKSSKLRNFMKFGELLNIISEKLEIAVNYEKVESLEENCGIAFTNISEKWDALKSSEKAAISKTTKEGFVNGILGFLENQKLINFIKEDDMILTTPKLDKFMDWNILNKNNYERIREAFGEVEYEQD